MTVFTFDVNVRAFVSEHVGHAITAGHFVVFGKMALCTTHTGRCMNVCFMAGISAEDAEAIPRFQQKLASAAVAARDTLIKGHSGRAGYFNLLVRLDRHSGGARARGRKRLGDVGVLASRNPVALDQATWDLVVSRMDGPLSSWSGFQQDIWCHSACDSLRAWPRP